LKEAVTLSASASPQSQAQYLYNLALDEAELQETASAEKHYRQALRLLGPTEHAEDLCAEIMLDLANVLFTQGRADEGRQQLQDALKLVTGVPGLLRMRARILVNLANDMS